MALEIGSRLGHYEVTALIGEGGMGQVYQATDTKLNRQVALKILPEAFASDPDRLARFQREAQVLASLNHPNIAAIHGLEDSEGTKALVLELVEGPTLADRIAQGPIPVDEALPIAKQIAEALEAAHEAGVIHRDLKPANIKVKSDGTVKVLDFGLAKALDTTPEGDPSLSPTLTAAATQMGVIMGTAAYMSPEQARGTTVDKRADIWTFGAVLYEMLIGQPLFSGETVTDVLAAIVTKEPDWTRLPRETPPSLRTVLRRCLTGDLKRRAQHIGDVRLEIDEALRTGHQAAGTADVPMARAWHGAKVQVVVFGFIILALGIVSYMFYSRGPAGFTVGQTQQLTFAAGLELDPVVSQDGRMLAYAAGGAGRMDIFVRQVVGGDAINLTEDIPGDHRWPQWSPDGTTIAFRASLPNGDNVVSVVPSLGGTARNVARRPDGILLGHAWSPDGERLVYAGSSALYISSIREGSTELLSDAFSPHSPSWSPDGAHIAYVSGNPGFAFSNVSAADLANVAPSSIRVVPAGGGDPQSLTDNSSLNVSPVWAGDGRSLFFISDRGGGRDVYHVRLGAPGTSNATPVRLTTGLDAFTLSVSLDSRSLLYSVYSLRSNMWSIPVPADGVVLSASDARPVTNENQVIEGMSVSPDGRMLAFDSSRSGNQDIYTMPRSGGEAVKLTTDPSDDFSPSWSPDALSIAFHSFRTGNRDLFVIAAEGGRVEQVTDDAAQERYPDWSPDGERLVFFSDKSGTGRPELYVVSREGGGSGWGTPRQLTFDGGGVPKWSRDGRWIAYTFGDGNGLRVITPEGGEPTVLVAADAAIPKFTAWSVDSRSVYYRATEIDGQSSFWSIAVSGGVPTLLVRLDDPSRRSRSEFDTDGTDFFFTVSESESDIWMTELLAQ